MPTTTTTTGGTPRHRSASIVLILAGLGVLLAYPLLNGSPAHHVHVRWKPGLTAYERHGYERALRLRERGGDNQRSFGYDLVDPSAGNIQAILEHPAVEDTHDLDRRTLSVSPSAPITASRTGYLWRWRAERWLPAVVALGVTGIAAGLLLFVPWSVLAGQAGRAGALAAARFEAAMPRLGPVGFGVFRAAFGVGLVWFVLDGAMDAGGMPLYRQRDLGPFDFAWMHRFAATPGALTHLEQVMLASLACFIAGLWPRAAFAVFALAVLPFSLAWGFRAGTHPLGLLPLALLVLLFAPWNDGVGVSWWLRRNRPPARGWTLAPRGFAPWVLCLAVSVGYAAAAYSKVKDGPGWVLNGTVRYHFMAEAEIAPVQWGTWIAARPALAVAASFAAVALESTLFLAVLVASPWLRLAFGLAAVGLFTGFFLFHNALWPAWWTLLLGFLPWGLLDRVGHAAPGVVADRARPAALAWVAVVLLVAQQVVVAGMRVEWSPFFSAYDMYSTTFPSVEAFLRANGGPRLKVMVETTADATRDVGDCVRRDRAAVDELTAVAGQDAVVPLPARARDQVTTCARAVDGGTLVRVLADQRIYDFEHGRTYYRYRDRVLGEWKLR